MIAAELMQMTMEDLIRRINELAHKAKSEGLTEDETKERDALRRQYLDAIKRNLTAQLDNTYIVTPDGRKTKLHKKEERN